MNTQFSLPGIQSIAYLLSQSLSEYLTMQAISKVPVAIDAALLNPICFSGEPTCECTQSNASIGLSQNLELTFCSKLQLPDNDYLAFLITDANGQSYLVGTKEEHPLIERVQSFGTPEGDPSTFTYRIQLTSPQALIPCSVA